MTKLVTAISMGIVSIQKDLNGSTRRVITINSKRQPPPPPRKVIIQRFNKPLPAKPQGALIERWMPYTEVKRRVIYQKPPPEPTFSTQRNQIIQWHSPRIIVKKQIKNLGVVNCSPHEYVARYGNTLKNFYELPQFAKDLRRDKLFIANHFYDPFTTLEGGMFNFVNSNWQGLNNNNFKDLFVVKKPVSVRITQAAPISSVSSPISRFIIN